MSNLEFHTNKVSITNSKLKSNIRHKHKILIISTIWNSDYLKPFINNIISNLDNENISIDHFEVPGSFEIPYMVKKLFNKSNDNGKRYYSGAICIGAIVKGDTAHFEYISNSVVYGLMKIQIEETKPIINGVLNCYNLDQMLERLDESSGLAISLAKSLMCLLD